MSFKNIFEKKTELINMPSKIFYSENLINLRMISVKKTSNTKGLNNVIFHHEAGQIPTQDWQI